VLNFKIGLRIASSGTSLLAWPKTLRLAYSGPPIAIDADAARAAMIVDRIRARCPELTPADLLLVSRVINASQRWHSKRVG
jgi:hypothetical protein